MSRRLVGRWFNEGWEVNLPSVEPPDLISVRVIVPHATSQEDKVWGRSDCGGRREGRTLALRRVTDSREEGLQPSLLVTEKWRHSLIASWSQLGGG
jgi:hypothetical protein